MKRQTLLLILLSALFLNLTVMTKITVFSYSSSTTETQSLINHNDVTVEGSVRIEYEEENKEVPQIETTASTFDGDFILYLKDGAQTKAITLEEYLISVVMAEVPYTFESEALKAQAVASRSYTMKLIESGTRHGELTVCTSASHCSAFLNENEFVNKYGFDAYEKAYAAAKAAVNATDGELVTYNSEICTAVYHAASYVSTENSYELWGTYTPYLLSVPTPEEDDTEIVKVKISKLESFLASCGAENFSAYSVSLNMSDSGRCESLSAGNITVKSSKIRSAFGLRSCDFTLKFEGDTAIFTSHGYGHGIGMSQEGANVMAKEGRDYREILCHYYTGVEIVHASDILKKAAPKRQLF